MSWSDDNEQSLGVDVIGWNLIIIIKKKTYIKNDEPKINKFLKVYVGIYAQIIYFCDFLNKINKQYMLKSICECRENQVKLTNQMNENFLIQN